MSISKLNPNLYPACSVVSCPFCGCMGDNTCKLYNIAQHSIQYIREYPNVLDYCKEPLKYISETSMKSE